MRENHIRLCYLQNQTLSSNENYVENSDELTLWKDCGNVGNEIWSIEDRNYPPWIEYDGCRPASWDINEVKIVDKISPVSTAYWFYLAGEDLTEIDVSNIDTSNVTNMSYMFAESSNLTSILVGEKWKEAEKKDNMFDGCGVSAVTPKT